VDFSSFATAEIAGMSALPSGAALLAMKDGRILRTSDMFQTSVWVQPGAVGGGRGGGEKGEEGGGGDARGEGGQGGDFYASPSFRGSKPGYVFKRGAEGLGYYRDPHTADMWEPMDEASLGCKNKFLQSASIAEPMRSEHLAESLCDSFGAPLLAITAPDSNRIFVVGRAPLAKRNPSPGGSWWAEAHERITVAAKALRLNPDHIGPAEFATVTRRMGHAKMSDADACKALKRIDRLGKGAVSLEHVLHWHMQQVCVCMYVCVFVCTCSSGTYGR
jgi:hypothetical protein